MQAAIRTWFEIQGFVRGEPRIVIEHVNRITKAAAPHWPRTKLEDDDCYRVIVRGSPNIVQETALRGERDGDSNAGGCLATLDLCAWMVERLIGPDAAAKVRASFAPNS